MKVWLDDVRKKPADFDIWLKTADAAITALGTGGVSVISLDHDLGDESTKTGYDVAKYIEEAAYKKLLGPVDVLIHSANPVGRRNMERAINRARLFWRDW
jgi:hypothetical protein